MLITCPKCDAMVPMVMEFALQINNDIINCPCCEEPFYPFKSELEEAEIKVEELKDQLVINQSLKNNSRLFDDC